MRVDDGHDGGNQLRFRGLVWVNVWWCAFSRIENTRSH